jgi:hypothetical protein
MKRKAGLEDAKRCMMAAQRAKEIIYDAEGVGCPYAVGDQVLF